MLSFRTCAAAAEKKGRSADPPAAAGASAIGLGVLVRPLPGLRTNCTRTAESEAAIVNGVILSGFSFSCGGRKCGTQPLKPAEVFRNRGVPHVSPSSFGPLVSTSQTERPSARHTDRRVGRTPRPV